MAILPKPYLSFWDLAEYLTELGYPYDVLEPYDIRKLAKDAYDLIAQNKIKAVFEHTDNDQFISAYFVLGDAQARKILIDNMEVSIKGHSQLYRYTTGKTPEKSEWISITKDTNIGLNDLYIPATELDNLFHKGADIDQQLADAQATIDRLQAENEQLRQAQTSQPIDTPTGLEKINAERAELKATGKAIAAYLWQMDTERAIRTGDMVQQLKAILYNINPDLVPQDKTLAGWLADVAPDYAKKAGRTPDNLPNEISLIMKR